MLKVNEIFGPTIQGEGKSIGMSCAFLRLANCNLHCIWCDTPYTWNWLDTKFLHPDKYNKSKEVYIMSDEEIIIKFQNIGVKAVVISGGEPFLQHKQLISLCIKLKELNYWIEVETNGTIYPNKKLIDLVNQINCSPKLSNSQNSKKQRICNSVLSQLTICKKVNFKFVVESLEDINEVSELQNKFHFSETYLMPQAQTKEELFQKGFWLYEFCSKHSNFLFCTRLSIMIADRGV